MFVQIYAFSVMELKSAQINLDSLTAKVSLGARIEGRWISSRWCVAHGL